MSRTSLRLRVTPRYPVGISGDNGLVATREQFDVVIKNAFDGMIIIPSVDNPDKIFILTWNADLDLYSIMSFTDTFAAAIDVTGLMSAAVYDPNNHATDAFARANHTGMQAESTVTNLVADLATLTAAAAAAQTTANNALPKAGGTMTGAIQDLVIAPSVAPTKKAAFDLSLVTAGQQRSIVVPDADLALSKWELIGDYVISAGTAALAVTNLSNYRKLRISGKIIPSAVAQLLARTSSNNGVSYDATAGNYLYQVMTANNATITGSSSASATSLFLTAAADDSGLPVSFDAIIEGFNKAATAQMNCRAVLEISAAIVMSQTVGNMSLTAARNAIQILPSTGTMSGNITIEGIRG